MANKMRGDVPLNVGDKKYTLCFDHGALIELEDQLDVGIVAISNELQSWQGNPDRIRLKWIRALLYVGLKKHQPAITLEDTNEMLGYATQGPQVMEAIGDAMAAAFGTTSKETDPRPLNGDARSGTGTVLSPNTSPSDTNSIPSGGSLPQN